MSLVEGIVHIDCRERRREFSSITCRISRRKYGDTWISTM